MTKSLTYVEIDVPDFVEVPLAEVLLNFDDMNSPPEITDENSSGGFHEWTIFGNAFIDQSDFKFGPGSLKLDGTGDYVTTPDSEEFVFGSRDFTIDCWFKVNAAGGTTHDIAGQSDSGLTPTTRSFNIDRQTTNFMTAKVVQGSTLFTITGTTQFTNAVNTGWHHLAFVRTGDILKLFIDGVQESSDLAFTGAVNNSAFNLSVGRDGESTANTWNGWIDGFRISIGEARWTSSFTPPADAPTNGITTYRFAIDAAYLPIDIPCIPSIRDVTITPAIVSLGENLGQRASVVVTFHDHRHIFASELFDSGTFWGKFRARHGQKLTGRALRVLRGSLGDSFDNIEIRHYIIESTDGPNARGEYKIIAKDILKLADGDRAQAPAVSNGFLASSITNVATSATLSPADIGNEEYPASGWVAIGGKEIVSFTRSTDTLTITRGWFGTSAQAHSAQDRVQLVLRYDTEDPADIIFDLLQTYAGLRSSYLPVSDWLTETETFLGQVYSATIAEPTSVNELISELIEQAALAMWWDTEQQVVRLQVLRDISTTADTFSPDNVIEGSLETKEQPEKRLSQVWTYFGQINPLVAKTNTDNYRSTAATVDVEAEDTYGIPTIKKIFSRWIPDGGRAIAERVNTIQLARFRDPPRRFAFDLLRGAIAEPNLGGGFRLEAWSLQDTTGAATNAPIQVTRLNPEAALFRLEAEEMLFTGGVLDPDDRTIIFDTHHLDVNLRDVYDSLYPAPESGDVVMVIINSGISIGSTNPNTEYALDIGDWPAGVDITIVNNGRIQGAGGNGGDAPAGNGAGQNGHPGGWCIFTRYPISLDNTNGQIWAGGGGGGGRPEFIQPGGGGGGGAGWHQAQGGTSSSGNHGAAGTTEAGGLGGRSAFPDGGGAGGGPGLAGSAPNQPVTSGGAAGISVDGWSFVTNLGTGDRRGATIN